MIDISHVRQPELRQLVEKFMESSEAWRDKEFPNKSQGAAVAESIMIGCDAAINDESQHPFSLENSIKICKKYGTVHGISRQLELEGEQNLLISRLAQTIRQTNFDRQDEALQLARDLLESAASYYMRVGDKEKAAIEITNSALMSLEKNAGSLEEIEAARDALIQASKLRKTPHDWAFSEFNLGICERIIAERTGYPRNLVKSSWDRILRSHRVLEKNGGFPADSTYYARNLGQTVVAMAECERREQLAKRFECHADSIPRTLIENLDPFQIVDAIQANPGVFGYTETPAWVREKICTSSIKAMILKAQSEIENSLKSGSVLDRSGALWQRWQLKYLDSEKEFDETAHAALDDAWNFGSREAYFGKASKIVGLICAPSLQGAYNDHLIKISEFLHFILRRWEERDIEVFLKKNNVTFRFVAAELSASGFSEEAFDLLESSRAMRVSGALSRPSFASYKSHEGVNDFCWVHLSHSPRATVIIGCNYSSSSGFEYFSKSFPALSGKVLSVLFSGVTKDLGLLPLHFITNNPSARIEKTERIINKISDLLGEIADYIFHQSGSDVVRISPGGYYQALPLAALRGTDQSLVMDKCNLATAPSLTVCLMPKPSLNPSSTVYFASADNVPGLPRLASSQREKSVIAGLYNLVPVEASRTDLMGLSIPEDLLHFSGHSASNWDPSKSSLMLENGTLSADDILRNGPWAGGVLLSSCESGLAQNFMDQEEYLSLQSAFLYRGACVTVGTMWPVLDFVAFVFFARMYFELHKIGRSGIDELCLAFRRSQRWMRIATLLELQEFLDECEGFSDLPQGMGCMSPQARPFESIVNWGCFSLMARLE